MTKYHSQNITVIASAGGATISYYSSGFDATEMANLQANWVVQHKLDGLDADYEDSHSFWSGGADWLITYTKVVRNILPKGCYIFAHAPQTPYWQAAQYGNKAYNRVHSQVGDMIDFYLTQFYNQGATAYDTYECLFIQSTQWIYETAVKQLHQLSNLPYDKIVIGKICTAADGGGGWLDPYSFGQFYKRYYDETAGAFDAGWMIWQLKSDTDFMYAKSFEAGFKGQSRPSSGGSTPPPDNGGSTPPPDNGGSTPPPDNGGSTPPPVSGDLPNIPNAIPSQCVSSWVNTHSKKTHVKVAYLNTVTNWYGNAVLSDLHVPGSIPTGGAPLYTHVIFTFLLDMNIADVDVALLWRTIETYGITTVTGTREQMHTKIRDLYHGGGMSPLVSSFGATLFPTTAGANAKDLGRKHAQWVIDNKVDGLDADYEDSAAFQSGTRGYDWVVTYNAYVRELLPMGCYLLAHAPQGPYFDDAFSRNCYQQIDKVQGYMIDFYFVQFYNQGDSSYDTYEKIFTAAGGWCPQSSIKQIHDIHGVPYSRLIVGKPATINDVGDPATSTGMVQPYDLGVWYKRFQQATQYDTGFMIWQLSSDAKKNYYYTKHFDAGYAGQPRP